MTFIGGRTDIPDCLVDADIYLHPSHREGLPISIIESLEFGLPAVVWDIPGCNELVIDDKNGYLPKFGDVQVAADPIDRLLSDEDLYARVSKEAVIRFQKITTLPSTPPDTLWRTRKPLQLVKISL